MPTTLSLGDTVARSGCMTRLNYVVGRSPDDLETAVGYKKGRLRQGFYCLLLADTLGKNDIEFYGYSIFSGGKIGLPNNDPVIDAGRTPVQTRLTADVGARGVERLAENFSANVSAQGGERFVKIKPIADEDDPSNPADGYPWGTGVPQWNLPDGHAKRFFVAAEVHGSVWSLASGSRLDVSLADYRLPYASQPARRLWMYLSEVRV